MPGIDPVLQVFLDDANPFADIQKKMNEYTSWVTGFFGGDNKSKAEDTKAHSEIMSTV